MRKVLRARKKLLFTSGVGIVIVMWIFIVVMVYAGAGYNSYTSGARMFKHYLGTKYSPVTGYTTQKGTAKAIAKFWAGADSVRSKLMDTVYTPWTNIGSQAKEGKELYSIRAITKITSTDTIASWDSADVYQFALQSCQDPYSADSVNFVTYHLFAVLNDTGTQYWFCPAESVYLYSYWAPYMRGRLVITAYVDSLIGFLKGLPSLQSSYKAINYQVLFRPLWR